MMLLGVVEGFGSGFGVRVEAHCLELRGGGAADPGEPDDIEGAAQHLAQQPREAGVGREVREEARALPVRHACRVVSGMYAWLFGLKAATLVQCIGPC